MSLPSWRRMSKSERLMSAVTISSPGGPDVLTLEQVSRPQADVGEVLVEVAYAGVNRPDVLQRRGLYPVPEGASPLPGLEVSGHVVSDNEPDLRPGTPVCALCNGGGYAELVAVPRGQVLEVPRGMTLRQAAALPEALFTVWYNLFELGQLSRGEALLVHGGTSGIGTTAIQLAKAFGARVYTTAGSAEKCQAASALGAVAFNYREDDFVTAVRAHEDGVDVVLDMVGGDYLPKNLALLRDLGRHVSIAFLRGNLCEIDLMTVMKKRLTLTGSTLRPRTATEKAAIAAALREHVWPLLERGELAPVIDTSYPLADAPRAHARMEASEHIGKMVLEVGAGGEA